MGLPAWAQEAPSGWKVVKDQQGVCQLTVPSNWQADKVTANVVKSPDGKLNALPSEAGAGQSFQAVKASAKQMMPPVRIIEDSGNRLWFSYVGRSPEAGGNYYVTVAGNPVCQAQITYKTPSGAATAQKIAESLTQAK
jgi:hypothetical protein